MCFRAWCFALVMGLAVGCVDDTATTPNDQAATENDAVFVADSDAPIDALAADAAVEPDLAMPDDLSGADFTGLDLLDVTADATVVVADMTTLVTDLVGADFVPPPPDLLPPLVSSPVFAETNGGLNGGSTKAVIYIDSTHLVAATGLDVYTSNDGGTSWTRLGSSPILASDYSDTISALAASGSDYFVGTARGHVFRYTGGTGSWSDVSPGGWSTQVVSLAAIAKGIVAATNTDVQLRDGTVGTWSGFTTGLTGTGYNLLFVGKQSTPELWLWSTSTGLWHTGVDTVSWSKFTTTTGVFTALSGTTSHTVAAVRNPDTTHVVTFREDGATTGNSCTSATSADIKAVGVTPGGGVVVRVTGGYQYVTACNGTWGTLSSDESPEITRFVGYPSATDKLLGYGNTGVYSLAVNPVTAPMPLSNGIHAVIINRFAGSATNAGILFAATNQGLYRLGASNTFSKVTLPATVFGAYSEANSVVMHSDGLLVAAIADKGLAWSNDSGSSWNASTETGVFSDVAYSEKDGVMLGCVGGTLEKGDLMGMSWTPVSPTQNCTLVAADPTSGHWFTATTSSLWRSDNQGATWTPLASGLFTGKAVQRIIVDPLDASSVIAVLNPGGAVRAISGSLMTLLANDDAEDLAIDPVAPWIYYMVERHGLHMSVDRGVSWSTLTSPFDNRLPRTVFVHPADRRQRWVGTIYEGVFFSNGTLGP